MEETYKINLIALKKKYPDVSKKIEKINLGDDLCLRDTRTGGKTLQVRINKKEPFFLHSQYDPDKESENIIERHIKQDYDVIIIGGLGLGYLVKAALAKKGARTQSFIIVEKDLRIFKAALLANDISDVLSSDKVHFFFEEDGEIQGLSDLLIRITTKKVFTLIAPFALKLDRDFYFNLNNVINSYIQRKNINIATLTRFQHLWVRNIFKNCRFFLSHKGISILFEKFASPVLVISAGPSLGENIETIRKYQDKFIIISADSCFQVLLKNSIIPDIVVAVDPQYINYKYFEYNKDSRPLLICEPSTFPLILEDYRGEKLFFSSVFPFVKWLETFTQKKGEIDMGGSVSTTAFDLALKLGGEPIILIGQDLAFVREQTHVRGSFVEKYWARRYNRFNTSLNGSFQYIHNNLFMKIKSNDGSMVNTDRRLMIFHAWFESKISQLPTHRHVFSTSRQGAKIGNLKVNSLEDIMKKRPFKNIQKEKTKIRETSSRIEEKKIRSIMTQLQEQTGLIRGSIHELLPVVDECIAQSEELYQHVKNNRKEKIPSLLADLDKKDEVIHSRSRVTELLSLLIQDKIHTILEEYEDHLTEQEKKNKDLNIARRSIFLYSGMRESMEIFDKLFDIIKF
ncbi:MAG: motility associated factor glycosyltransferase family protein [Spirochaetes bacterium]|nr:motility associated factor glycosyltransferase family protein [Spirochaetota bacterium]